MLKSRYETSLLTLVRTTMRLLSAEKPQHAFGRHSILSVVAFQSERRGALLLPYGAPPDKKLNAYG
ncbi:hypothetical protein GCM10023156_37830 [Novipirellula rosea]|uniref:Uncharacterized protein n=1 Tax=Novipirellula rosea TaxID=1031540 RepID=A0ABP8MZY8_9BACT